MKPSTCLSACLLTIAACGSNQPRFDADGGVPEPDTTVEPPDAESCQPPDMLIVLDRTQSMFRTPSNVIPENTVAGRASSKWGLAVKTVELVTSQFDGVVRFGLELFPLNPGGVQCVTLEQRIAGVAATNATCQGGEVSVLPTPSSSAAINAAIDNETTRLCNSTPIAAALETASDQLAAVADPVREQFVLLMTDGKNSCNDDNEATSTVHALAAAGVLTYVIGFGSGTGDGVDAVQLNQLACAGRTAKGFPAPCTVDASGNYTATDPAAAALYFDAEDEATLTSALASITGSVCCGCVL